VNEVDRKRERRRQAALERLGTNDPRCTICGEDDWRCSERHHVAGRRFDEFIVIVCRNCHRKQSDSQRDHARTANKPPNQMDCIGHFLLGLADLFELLIKKLREFGEALIAQA